MGGRGWNYSVCEEIIKCPDIFSLSNGRDGRKTNDPDRMILPNEAAALFNAECVIESLRTEKGANDPRLRILVTNEKHQTVLSIPFLAERAGHCFHRQCRGGRPFRAHADP